MSARLIPFWLQVMKGKDASWNMLDRILEKGPQFHNHPNHKPNSSQKNHPNNQPTPNMQTKPTPNPPTPCLAQPSQRKISVLKLHAAAWPSYWPKPKLLGRNFGQPPEGVNNKPPHGDVDSMLFWLVVVPKQSMNFFFGVQKNGEKQDRCWATVDFLVIFVVSWACCPGNKQENNGDSYLRQG